MTRPGQLLKVVYHRAQPLAWEEPWPSFEQRDKQHVAIWHPLLNGRIAVPYHWDEHGKERAREQLRILDEMATAGYRANRWHSLDRFGCGGYGMPQRSWADHSFRFTHGDDAVLFFQPYRREVLEQDRLSVAAYAERFDLRWDLHTRWPFYWPDGGIVCVELRAPLRRLRAATRLITLNPA